MATYDYDPDVTRWGLHHLLDVCTLTNNASCSGVTQYDQDLSRVEFVREGYCEKDNVENDEAVARALQEEIWQIDCLEASGVFNGGPEHLQESVLAQNWLGPSGRHYSYGHGNDQQAANEPGLEASGVFNGGPEHLQESVLAQNWLGPSGHDNDQQAANEPGIQMDNAVPCGIIIEEASDHNRVENDVQPEIKMLASCSIPGGEKPSYVDDLLHTFDIADESSLDGEVGKRLNQMVPIPVSICEKDNVENDEAVARALQEEIWRIDCLEASGVFNGGPEHLQDSVLAQNWLGPSGRHYSYGHDNDQQTANEPGIQMENAVPCGIIIEEASDHNRVENDVHPEIKVFASCSSPGGGEPSYVDDLLHIFDIADESSLDGEVGKRLNQMVPVPHVPKTIEKIPTVDEEISDHQRLLERLELYELVELKVQGDGNCQFRALSDQLYRSPDHHASVREQITQQLKCHPEMYGGYVPMAYNDYLKKMSKSGEWGDHVTLQAAADWFGVKIFVLTSFKDTCYIEILPHVEKSKRVIFLSFWAEVHYNSIYPKGDLPEVDTKKKRKWWNFGNLISS